MSSLAKRRPSGIVIYPYSWLDCHSLRVETLEEARPYDGCTPALRLLQTARDQALAWHSAECWVSTSQRLKVSCILVVTLEVTYLGTQLKFWYFCTLEFYSLALNLSILSHLCDLQRLKVSCTLVVTLEVTYLGT